MKRSQRLKVVLDLAARKEDDARKALQQSRQRLATETRKLSDLVDYQREYQRQFSEYAQGSVRVDNYQNYQRFITQISLAIEQQQQQIRMAEADADRMMVLWRECHDKQQGMSDFINRCVVEEQLADDKKLQKELDEHSQRRRDQYP